MPTPLDRLQGYYRDGLGIYLRPYQDHPEPFIVNDPGDGFMHVFLKEGEIDRTVNFGRFHFDVNAGGQVLAFRMAGKMTSLYIHEILGMEWGRLPTTEY